jgi:hypothetical protein
LGAPFKLYFSFAKAGIEKASTPPGPERKINALGLKREQMRRKVNVMSYPSQWS